MTKFATIARFAWQVSTGYVALALIDLALWIDRRGWSWPAHVITPRLGIFYVQTEDTGMRSWFADWRALNAGQDTP